MEDNSFSSFSKKIKKVKDSRNHKVKNSYGVYDGYKYYRKNKPKEKEYILTESQYFFIIRRFNELLGEALVNGEDIDLPCRLGRLELRKNNASISIKDGKLKTNLPTDWSKTLKLWHEDDSAFKNKVLIKMEEKEVFKVYYNRIKADYTNKSFYQFNINRNIKNKLKINIKEGSIDAFSF